MSFITASNVFLSVDDRTRPWIYFQSRVRSDAERAVTIHGSDHGGSSVAVDLKIHDGREKMKNKGDLTLDACSFELVDCPTKLSTNDFYRLQGGEEELATKYYKEVEEFVAKKLGCDKVICIHSQVRNAEKTGQDGVQGYAGGAPHTDSSSVSGDIEILRVLKSRGIDPTQYKRYCYLNLWRNIGGEPIVDDHLAVLDERSVVKPDDYIPKDLVGEGYEVTQYGLNARHAEQHQWYYFPKMTRNEGILFKQMDSDWTVSGRVCFHMSVADPTAPKEHNDAVPPTRESIEVRMMCLWKEATVDSMPTEENIHSKMIKSPQHYAIQLKGSNLLSASLFQLLAALLCKLPIVGRLFGMVLGTYVKGSTNQGGEDYSGNPQDYSNRFVAAIGAFDSWPAFAKTWVKQQMAQCQTAQEGIEALTKVLVDDQAGYQKTQYLSSEAKAEIVSFLLQDEEYMKLCNQFLAPLVDGPK